MALRDRSGVVVADYIEFVCRVNRLRAGRLSIERGVVTITGEWCR